MIGEQRRRLLTLLRARAGALHFSRDYLAQRIVGSRLTSTRRELRSYPPPSAREEPGSPRCASVDIGGRACSLAAGHDGYHGDGSGWHWLDAEQSWREKPRAAELPHWRAAQPPATRGRAARPWCYHCRKPVTEFRQVPLRDGRIAVVADCHGERQSVVATAEELRRVEEWKTAFAPGTIAIMQLDRASASPAPPMPVLPEPE